MRTKKEGGSSRRPSNQTRIARSQEIAYFQNSSQLTKITHEEVRNMCQTCGCTPCKCGRKIVNGVCEGCGKAYDDCTCEKK